MTAINVVVDDNQVSVVTDTLARTGVGPDFHVAKCMQVPHMRLAVATRGPMTALTRVVGAICVGAFNFDSARAFLAEAYGKLGFDDVEIIVAGISAKGPAACVVSKSNTGGKVLDIEHVLVTPAVSAEAADAFAANPIRGMKTLLAKQAGADVGGWMNVTIVGEHVIESYCAGRIG